MKAILTLAFALTCGLISAADTNGVAPNRLPPAIFTHVINLDVGDFLTKLKKVAPPAKNESNRQLMVRFFKENGVRIEPPCSVYLNDSRGTLLLYNTLGEIDKTELLVNKVIHSKFGS